MPKPAKNTEVVQTAPPVREKKLLRTAQVRILKCLSTNPMTRAELMENKVCASSDLVSYLGHLDEEKRKVNDERWSKSLITLGFVKVNMKKETPKGEETYSITPAGKSALAKAEREVTQDN